MNPRYPIFIPSKGRAERQMTSTHLSDMGVPHYVIVEEQERETYERHRTALATLVTLDDSYRDRHETLDDFGRAKSFGAGPARNMAWDLALDMGAKRHWDVDDNIAGFWRLNLNRKTPVADGTIIRAMEDFTDRYDNVALSGPNYYMFAPRKQKQPPITINTRIYSCTLIRNDLPFRWRLRMNEDTDLSLRVLKAGWTTILFNAFLQWKMPTQTVKGGYLSEFYGKEGTDDHLEEADVKRRAKEAERRRRTEEAERIAAVIAAGPAGPELITGTTFARSDSGGETFWKSQMLVDAHPDVARIAWRFGRWHHFVDYSVFKQRLQPRAGLEVPEGVDNYGMALQYNVDGTWVTVRR